MEKIENLKIYIDAIKDAEKENFENFSDLENHFLKYHRQRIFFPEKINVFELFEKNTRYYCPLCQGPCKSFFPDGRTISLIVNNISKDNTIVNLILRDLYKGFDIDSNHFNYILGYFNLYLNAVRQEKAKFSKEEMEKLENEKLYFI